MRAMCTDINPDLLAGEPCEPDFDLDLSAFEEEAGDDE